MAASAALTVYIHHVARISPMIRSTAPPSNREIASDTRTEMSGATASNEITIDTTIAVADRSQASSRLRNKRIVIAVSMIAAEMLKASLWGGFLRARINTGTATGNRASNAIGGERNTNAKASGISDSVNEIPSRRNWTLKTVYSNSPNNNAAITNAQGPASRTDWSRSGIATITAADTTNNAPARPTTCSSGRPAPAAAPPLPAACWVASSCITGELLSERAPT